MSRTVRAVSSFHMVRVFLGLDNTNTSALSATQTHSTYRDDVGNSHVRLPVSRTPPVEELISCRVAPVPVGAFRRTVNTAEGDWAAAPIAQANRTIAATQVL